MSTKGIITCCGCSFDLGELLRTARESKHRFGPQHALSALPGRDIGLIENPFRSQVEANVLDLCRSIGLTKAPLYYSWVAGGRLTALCFPNGGFDRLRICDMAMIIAFMFDDALDVRRTDKQRTDDMATALKSAIAGAQSLFFSDHPLVKLAYEIHRSLEQLGPSVAWMERFQRSFDGFVDMAVSAAKRWLNNEGSVDLIRYLHERYYDVAVGIVLALAELTQGSELEAEALAYPALARMQSLCTFHIAFVNDIFSYHKEVIENSNLNNAIAVFQMQFGFSFEEAVAAVVLLVRRFYDEFQRLAAASSPSLSAAQHGYIEAMHTWMIGATSWSLESHRYRHVDSAFRELREQPIEPAKPVSAREAGAT